MANRRSSDLDLLLSDAPLEGEHAAWREIGPELLTTAVDSTSIASARDAIGLHCSLWGGGCSVLLPVDPKARRLEQPWLELVCGNRLDRVSGRDLLNTDAESYKRLDVNSGGPLTESVLTILASSQLDDEAEIRIDLPDENDPWWVAYAGTLGLLPDSPPQGLVQRAGLTPDLEWGALLNLARETVAEPSARDLISRLRSRTASNARALSLHELRVRPAPWSQDLVTSPTWVQRGWNRQFVGSNIVVVYEPGSVADLCLLWTLRSAHALYQGLPLAVPATADVVVELEDWTDHDDGIHFAPRLRGFGRPWGLISASVPTEQLAEIAGRAQGPWEAFTVGDLLQPPSRPSRPSVDMAHFTDGAATVSVWDPTDRELLLDRPMAAFGLDLRGRIVLSGKPLPPLRALRSGFFGGGGWVGGGYDFQVSTSSDTVAVEWPSSWALLQAAAAEHGLQVRPSRPGQAAAALLERIGSFEALEPLKDDRVLAQLDRLGERVGISWFRSRLRSMQSRLAAGNDDAAARSVRIEAQLDEMVVPPVDDAQHELTASQLQSAFGLPTARAWLAWAEDSGLIVRGARVECVRCGTRGWRAAAELAIPLACAGCGETIARPFPADTLTFRYRASRLLVEVQASDAIPHVLCAAWWVTLFRRGWLTGVYPGVEFLDGNKLLAEIDVVLLLQEGTLAFGECKRRAAGLLQQDLDRMDELAERVDAGWTFAATPGWAADAPEIWQSLRRELPERRRFALCAEQLQADSRNIMARLGSDPTAWAPADAAAREVHQHAFKERLPRVISRLERPLRMADWVIGS
jgi:hypothetical protein